MKRKRDEEFRRAAYPQLFGSDSEEKKEEPESTEENITVEDENQTSCDDDKSTEDKEDKIEENYSFDNKSNIADSVQSTIEPKKTIVTQDIVIEKNRIIINCNDQVCYKERITVTFERWYKKGKRVIRKTTKTQKWTKE